MPTPFGDCHVDEPPLPLLVIREVYAPSWVRVAQLHGEDRHRAQPLVGLLREAGDGYELPFPVLRLCRLARPMREGDCLLRPIRMPAENSLRGREETELPSDAVPAECDERGFEVEPLTDEDG